MIFLFFFNNLFLHLLKQRNFVSLIRNIFINNEKNLNRGELCYFLLRITEISDA